MLRALGTSEILNDSNSFGNTLWHLKSISSLIKYNFTPCALKKTSLYVINFHLEIPKKLSYTKYNRITDIRDEKNVFGLSFEVT